MNFIGLSRIFKFNMEHGHMENSYHRVNIEISDTQAPRFNIKMTSCQYRKSHCGDKTILRPSYLHNGISYTDKTTSLYWIRAQAPMQHKGICNRHIDPTRSVSGVFSPGVLQINGVHYNDVIMGAIASQITSLTIIYSIVYSDANQRKHQSSASLVFARGIHRGEVPAQMASNAENVSIWWRHHGWCFTSLA